MSTIKYLDNKNPDGTVLGQDSATLISFYGVTPVVQPSGATQGVMSAALTGLTQDAVVSVCVSAINATNILLLKLRSDLIAVGVIKGSA